MRIETLPIETLRPYPRNARTHSKKQIRQIADSILNFGFCNPQSQDAASRGADRLRSPAK
jgi:ParB-like chromosome segregation protein Spo0J